VEYQPTLPLPIADLFWSSCKPVAAAVQAIVNQAAQVAMLKSEYYWQQETQ
jgi:hypothetical protein